MAKPRKIWGVTSYDLGGNSGYVVQALFTTREAAETFAAYRPEDYEVEEFALFDQAPPQWHYYTAITHVYPDGTMERGSFDKHTAEGLPVAIASADLFDGHMQGHCGVHIYVSGRDKDRVRATYKKLVAKAKREATGVCSCGRTELWKRDWLNDPVRDREREECAKTHGEGWCSTCGTYTVKYKLEFPASTVGTNP